MSGEDDAFAFVDPPHVVHHPLVAKTVADVYEDWLSAWQDAGVVTPRDISDEGRVLPWHAIRCRLTDYAERTSQDADPLIHLFRRHMVAACNMMAYLMVTEFVHEPSLVNNTFTHTLGESRANILKHDDGTAWEPVQESFLSQWIGRMRVITAGSFVTWGRQVASEWSQWARYVDRCGGQLTNHAGVPPLNEDDVHSPTWVPDTVDVYIAVQYQASDPFAKTWFQNVLERSTFVGCASEKYMDVMTPARLAADMEESAFDVMSSLHDAEMEGQISYDDTSISSEPWWYGALDYDSDMEKLCALMFRDMDLPHTHMSGRIVACFPMLRIRVHPVQCSVLHQALKQCVQRTSHTRLSQLVTMCEEEEQEEKNALPLLLMREDRAEPVFMVQFWAQFLRTNMHFSWTRCMTMRTQSSSLACSMLHLDEFHLPPCALEKKDDIDYLAWMPPLRDERCLTEAWTALRHHGVHGHPMDAWIRALDPVMHVPEAQEHILLLRDIETRVRLDMAIWTSRGLFGPDAHLTVRIMVREAGTCVHLPQEEWVRASRSCDVLYESYLPEHAQHPAIIQSYMRSAFSDTCDAFEWCNFSIYDSASWMPVYRCMYTHIHACERGAPHALTSVPAIDHAQQRMLRIDDFVEMQKIKQKGEKEEEEGGEDDRA
jgi:hypothetical protein